MGTGEAWRALDDMYNKIYKNTVLTLRKKKKKLFVIRLRVFCCCEIPWAEASQGNVCCFMSSKKTVRKQICGLICASAK